jgi:hypothetical protein
METAGYSATPLVKKLGLRDGQQVIFKQTPPHYFRLLGKLPKVNRIASADENTADFIHLFCTEVAELENLFPLLKAALKPAGILWVSWPKGSSAIESDLNGNIVREFGLAQGLVDVKVCAVDVDWSGLKFMYRLKDRK